MKMKFSLLVLGMTLAFAGVTQARSHITGDLLALSKDKNPSAGAGAASSANSANSASLPQQSAPYNSVPSQSAPSQKSQTQTLPAPVTPTLPQSVQLDVPSQAQDPELYNGCEVTSLSMLLNAAGHLVPKTVLADEVVKDSAPEVEDADGNPISWGNPNRGFVGDITGTNPGYGVYHGPIASLLGQFMPGQAYDLTGSSFDAVLQQVAAGKPVVVWATVYFAPTTSWVTWQSPTGPVRATLDEHCVLLVGYNAGQVILNDPLDGAKNKAVDRKSFIAAWQQLGQQAVTYK